MSKLSVIIPTYKEPDYLDLCISSAIIGAGTKDYELIVVVDGTEQENKEVIKTYQNNPNIRFLKFSENRGLSVATNYGIYIADSDYVLVVNDDNVFPFDWDLTILDYCKIHVDKFVLTPNQIEPKPSMFSQFVIEDLGQSPESFDYVRFDERTKKLAEEAIKGTRFDFSGSTLPFAMNRNDYLALGGWDELYPSPHVVDWDFFLKCEYFNFAMIRAYDVHFYHFAGVATRSEEKAQESMIKENAAHEFFTMKWKNRASHDPITNSKLLPIFKDGKG